MWLKHLTGIHIIIASTPSLGRWAYYLNHPAYLYYLYAGYNKTGLRYWKSGQLSTVANRK